MIPTRLRRVRERRETGGPNSLRTGTREAETAFAGAPLFVGHKVDATEPWVEFHGAAGPHPGRPTRVASVPSSEGGLCVSI